MGSSVLFLIRSLNTGGAERQLVVLASELHRRGVRVAVITFYGGGAMSAHLRHAGVPIHSLEKRGRWDLLRFGWQLVSLIRSHRPAVLYCSLPTANILGALVRPLTGIPRVVFGVRASSIDYSQYDWFARAESRLAAVASRFADAVICNSEAGKRNCLQQGYRPGALFVVPNGIDAQRFCFDRAARERLRSAWGIGNDELLVGVIARLDPMKDHPSFLRASARLLAWGIRPRFICVGRGSKHYADALRSIATELALDQQLRWVEETDDIVSVYSSVDVVCSSSSMGEGFPNSIAEGMSCERVCVATDVGDARQIVGDAGRVVAAGDDSALASALREVISLSPTQRASLGARARRRVQECFSVERLADQTQALLGL